MADQSGQSNFDSHLGNDLYPNNKKKHQPDNSNVSSSLETEIVEPKSITNIY